MAGNIFNVTNPVPETNASLAEAYKRGTGNTNLKITYREPTNVYERFGASGAAYDVAKAELMLGWKARHRTLSEDPERYFKAFKAHQSKL